MSKKEIQKLTDSYNQDPVTKKLERIACYIRVSTQEQKLHGISLDAQRDKLKDYADTHKLKIVEWYEDEGVSGRKLIKNRPELQRMIKDAQEGKFDRIIFIKLDRFFRSVAEYHECMKKIDPVIWTATEEKYDLSTANGRAFVNMKITIAELEADQTGERIDIVNDYKVKTGQAITGSQSQLYGYIVQKDKEGIKRVVKDPETAHIVEEYIDHFLTYHNKSQAHSYVMKKYNADVSYNSLSKMLSDTKLCGVFRNNDNYIADPYVDMETFLKIQETLKKNIKKTGANRIYLFTGLISCPVCGNNLTGKYLGGQIATKKPSGKVYIYNRDYYYYRCNSHHVNKRCTFKKQLSESIIEKHLLEKFETYVTAYIKEVNVTDDTVHVDHEKINKQIASVKSEMTKVKRMYRKEDITEAEYDQDMEELKAELKELESQLEPIKERDITIYEELLKSGWRGLYNALTRENKRAFWRKYIETIEVNEKGSVKQPIFF